MTTALVVVALVAGLVTGLVLGFSLATPSRVRDRAAAGAIAEEAQRSALLVHERDRLVQAFDALDDGVIVVDGRGEVLVRNRAASHFHDARHSGRVVEEAIEALVAAAAHGDAGERELALFGPPKQVLSLRAAPLRTRGLAAGAVVWVRDVSESRRVDDMRRDFVANVSHELRTPIGALGLLAETIADEPDPDVMRHFAERLVRESERLARIVADLLDLSLIEMAEAPAREPVAVRDLVGEAADKARVASGAAGIALRVDDIDEALAVACDRRQMVSAIYNLLDNAVKYSEPGSGVEVSVTTDDTRVGIAVRDHGVGIPARDLERIFERFYRVDRARSRLTGGTGLGLSIVRHVAESHGGEVTVTSHEGEGSVFTLTLPRCSLRSRVASPVPSRG